MESIRDFFPAVNAPPGGSKALAALASRVFLFFLARNEY